LTDKTKKQYGAVVNPDPARWLAFVIAAGGSLFNKNQTKVTIDSPAAKQALDFYAGLVQKGCAATSSTVGAGWPGEAFGRVNGAIVFEGNWLTNVMQTTYPNVHWGVAPLPAGPKGHGNLAFTAAYVIAKNTKHPNEALTLLKYLTSKDGETKWAKLNSYIPSRSDSKPVSGTQVYIQAVKYSQDWFFPPHFSAALTPMGDDIQKVMEGTMSSSDALKDMQTRATIAVPASGGPGDGPPVHQRASCEGGSHDRSTFRRGRGSPHGGSSSLAPRPEVGSQVQTRRGGTGIPVHPVPLHHLSHV
jgi:ABC-type glycerol-3-phosphate transport system substrate-binding protein